MAAIRGRRELLLGEVHWEDLESEARQRLTGGYENADSKWWGLMEQMYRGKTWSAVCNRETEIREIRKEVRAARDEDDSAFRHNAVRAMKELMGKHVQHGTATLLLALACPDRLLSVNTASENALGKLSGIDASALREPEGYGELLDWLYKQRWYRDGPPADEDLVSIWRFRAALVDAFVYER